MSLPACQQRILDTIAGTLQVRDPRLASMFAIFTKLSRQEPMPAAEALQVSRLRWALRRMQWNARRVRRKARRLRQTGARRSRLRAFVIVPVVLAAFVSLIVLVPQSADQPACGAGPTVRSSVQPVQRSAPCWEGR